MNEAIYQGEVYVLIAIDEVRNELVRANDRGADFKEMQEIHTRLLSLYAILNVDNVLCMMDEIDERKAA